MKISKAAHAWITVKFTSYYGRCPDVGEFPLYHKAQLATLPCLILQAAAQKAHGKWTVPAYLQPESWPASYTKMDVKLPPRQGAKRQRLDWEDDLSATGEGTPLNRNEAMQTAAVQQPGVWNRVR